VDTDLHSSHKRSGGGKREVFVSTSSLAAVRSCAATRLRARVQRVQYRLERLTARILEIKSMHTQEVGSRSHGGEAISQSDCIPGYSATTLKRAGPKEDAASCSSESSRAWAGLAA